MKKILLFFLLLKAVFIFSQNQTINWNFGNKAALNFNGAQVNVLPDSEMNTPAGCSSISDKQGNLLFYTNGKTVWNKEHQIMENGDALSGEEVINQTSIIIPKPDSEEIYYIFSTRVNESTSGQLTSEGVYYATLEISNTFPLGKVLSNFSVLRDSSSQRITALHHKDGKSIWVITFGKEPGNRNGPYNTFLIYKIDDTTIAPPIKFVVEETKSSNGAMKGSPNGKLIAIADYSDQFVYFYNFNNETGIITTNSKFFTDTALSSPKSPYGIEFSRNSKILYYSGLVGGSTGSINQYVIENPFPDDPLFSQKKELFSSSGTQFGSLQLANDSKIYVALFNEGTNDITSSDKIGVLNFPEEIGFESQYNHNFLDLSSGASNKGLPNFIQTYFASRIYSENKCVGGTFSFFAESYGDINDINWDFGDGNNSLELTPDHIYSNPGEYVVTATLSLVNDQVIVTKTISVFKLPVLLDNKELIECAEDNTGVSNFNLFNISEIISTNSSTEEFIFYLSQNDLLLNNNITNPENYTNLSINQEIFVRVINENGCENSTSFFLKAQFVQLDTIPSFYTCENSDNIINDNNGLFNLIEIGNTINTQLNLATTSVLSFYDTFENAKLKKESLRNSIISNTRTIWVRVDDTLLGCNGIQSFDIIVNNSPNINLDETYEICYDIGLNTPIIISGDSSNSRFEWLDNNNIVLSRQQRFTLTQPGEYKHIAYKNQNGIECSNTKEFVVKIKSSPIFNSILLNTETENITIDITLIGDSNYQFSLDNNIFIGNGINHTFNYVNPGIVTVYVKDINNCEPPIQTNISVIGFPSFFTPNSDGNNEVWSVKGATTNFFSKIDITIFNRYGVILHKINNINPQGWDGNYKGLALPSGEYWYKANLIDLNGKIINKSGNFSLLRP